MAKYNIYRRNRSRDGKELTLVATVVAKDAVDAMERFYGEHSSSTFVAMRSDWSGGTYHIRGNAALAAL